ncbi:MAG: hypothetical protein E6343_06470 [Clostridium perfringens]|nr:hypothetical protein [Clostridium perfringens]
MSYKDGLEIILPTFLRINQAIEHGHTSIVLISDNNMLARCYLETIHEVLERTGNIGKVEKISICRNIGDISVAEKNKDNTLIILCGQWYRNKMFLHQGVLKAMSRLVTVSLPEIPSKVFNRSTNEVEYITNWFGDKSNG